LLVGPRRRGIQPVEHGDGATRRQRRGRQVTRTSRVRLDGGCELTPGCPDNPERPHAAPKRPSRAPTPGVLAPDRPDKAFRQGRTRKRPRVPGSSGPERP